jgi:hypothetical protein
MSRPWIWLQLLIGWLPIWALFTVLIMVAHGPGTGTAALIALRMVAAAAVLGIAVHRLSARLPWPHPFRVRFVGVHVVGAAVYSLTWFALNGLIESLVHGELRLEIGPGTAPYLTTGVWLYVMIAGVVYASRAAERTAQIQALEARTQLAALRAQLHPHFLFNALHTVVQLIPIDPRAAANAAERLAEALRIAIEETRDLLPLADEWAFVQRYLAIEGIRFGERLTVESGLEPDALECTLPSFALQTLVENAVRHAAAPRVAATRIRIEARLEGRSLILRVADDGDSFDPAVERNSAGTGLRRLRERLAWLYGSGASLALERAPCGGCVATLLLPQPSDTAHPEQSVPKLDAHGCANAARGRMPESGHRDASSKGER